MFVKTYTVYKKQVIDCNRPLAKLAGILITVSCFIRSFTMIRTFAATGLLYLAIVAPAFADTVDGLLVSINTDDRTVTLESGAMLDLTEYVVLDGLQPGQLVRVTYNDGTVDATAIDILEPAPVEPTEDTSVDTSPIPTVDGAE
jgi:hypothetical protein